MIYLVLAFTILHASFYCILTYLWNRIPTISDKGDKQSFSVVIPVRNEVQLIKNVLTCLEYQEYDKSKYEVIVIDDFSDDDTLQVVEECQVNFKMNLRVISLTDRDKSGKKYALTKGVQFANHTYILTTDADCQMGPLWLASYAAHTDGHKFIAGPVALKGRGFWASLQQVEFAGLIGFGAVTLSNKNPSICSGANLGFSKSVFEEVGGYNGNFQIPSGDDEFLLFKIQQQYPTEIMFLKNRSSVVLTPVHRTFKGFVNQRIRWTSKWKHNKNPKLRYMAILFFLDYLVLLIAFGLTIYGSLPITLIVALIILRWLFNVFFIQPIYRFFGFNKLLLPLFVIQLIYPFHSLFMGVNSIFGNYTWKGRRY